MWWILVAVASWGYSAPSTVAFYRTEAECLTYAAMLKQRTTDVRQMPQLNGVCIPSEK